MLQAAEFDLKQAVLLNDTFGPREVRQMQDAIGCDFSQYAVLRDAVGELQGREEHTPASRVRLGVCQYLLGRYYRAIETLQQADGGAMAHYYLAKSHFARQEYAEAIESYKAAEKAGYDAGDCALGRAEALRYSNNAVGALAVLDSLSGAIEQTAEYLTQRAATVAAMGGNPQEVVALYERAVESDRNHPGALFGLALENDRRGNDDTAMELYKRATDRLPTHVGSLINMGLLFEDREQYEKAAQCYQRILDTYPDHIRAALYFKDTEASHEQYYDEDAQRKRDRMSQVLGIPVTDFELSVRSRNCLQKMGIMTLGDLCRCTEQELLASKNFGETSLVEIKEMLATKGLRLGQYA
ncbi:MAG: DNA-directed RNA polymerase subunit alpha C-terminal domain-containing protein, partial [Thermoguttaceae bacterium]